MTSTDLSNKALEYLHRLCVEIPNRRVGSDGNRAATDLFAEVVDSFDFQTECPEFDCIDWDQDGALLTVNGERFEALVSPYSLGCQARAPLSAVTTIEELAAAQVENALLLLRGEIAKEQLMPKNFPFYNPDEHKRIIQLLETKKPLAIIAATARNPEMAGGIYPCPLIEDGDFDIPSVYMTEEEGYRLARHAGEEIVLESRSWRIPARGCNVVARKGAEAGRRIVFTAHIDARYSTPGALDNASGVVTLLLLAELLESYSGQLGLEIVAINGEDYYANPGEVQYLQSNRGEFDKIFLNINIDDVGFQQGGTAYSFYGCPDELASLIRKTFSSHPGMIEGDPWYQGDHMIFVLNQVLAVAVTSERAMQNLATITHTPEDKPELVDVEKLADLAAALRALLLVLEKASV